MLYSWHYPSLGLFQAIAIAYYNYNTYLLNKHVLRRARENVRIKEDVGLKQKGHLHSMSLYEWQWGMNNRYHSCNLTKNVSCVPTNNSHISGFLFTSHDLEELNMTWLVNLTHLATRHHVNTNVFGVNCFICFEWKSTKISKTSYPNKNSKFTK